MLLERSHPLEVTGICAHTLMYLETLYLHTKVEQSIERQCIERYISEAFVLLCAVHHLIECTMDFLQAALAAPTHRYYQLHCSTLYNKYSINWKRFFRPCQVKRLEVQMGPAIPILVTKHGCEEVDIRSSNKVGLRIYDDKNILW